jgi:phospholipid transport system substrate-binding protein
MKRIMPSIAAVLAGLLLLAPLALAQTDGSASALVKRTAERMLGTLESRRAEIDADPRLIYDLVGSILAPHFDFKMITRAAVGRDWRKATPAQQQELITGFRQLLVRTYAKSLLKYSDEEIVYEKETAGTRKGTVLVQTKVQAPGSTPLPVDYRLHRQSGSWKVYDVVIENVSLISNYRNEFKRVLAGGGIDALIAELDNKNSKGS